MPGDKVWPLAVVGAGPAGVAAAAEAARLGFPPFLMDSEGRAGGLITQAFQVKNFPGCPGAPGGLEIAMRLARQVEDWGIEIHEGSALELWFDEGLVHVGCDDGSAVRAEAVVVATGTRPRVPAIAGLVPVAFSASEVLSAGMARNVAVIGGSDSAFDQARFLRSEGVSVVLICRSERPRAPGWLVESAMDEGITVECGAEVVGCTKAPDEPGLLVSTGGSTRIRKADCVLAALGREPVLPGGVSALLDLVPDRAAVAGDARRLPGRYVVAAMGDGCLAARRLLVRGGL